MAAINDTVKTTKYSKNNSDYSYFNKGCVAEDLFNQSLSELMEGSSTGLKIPKDSTNMVLYEPKSAKPALNWDVIQLTPAEFLEWYRMYGANIVHIAAEAGFFECRNNCKSWNVLIVVVKDGKPTLVRPNWFINITNCANTVDLEKRISNQRGRDGLGLGDEAINKLPSISVRNYINLNEAEMSEDRIKQVKDLNEFIAAQYIYRNIIKHKIDNFINHFKLNDSDKSVKAASRRALGLERIQGLTDFEVVFPFKDCQTKIVDSESGDESYVPSPGEYRLYIKFASKDGTKGINGSNEFAVKFDDMATSLNPNTAKRNSNGKLIIQRFDIDGSPLNAENCHHVFKYGVKLGMWINNGSIMFSKQGITIADKIVNPRHTKNNPQEPNVAVDTSTAKNVDAVAIDEDEMYARMGYDLYEKEDEHDE
jgi:hypothetical protein